MTLYTLVLFLVLCGAFALPSIKGKLIKEYHKKLREKTDFNHLLIDALQSLRNFTKIDN
jgi:hypothetical protein